MLVLVLVLVVSIKLASWAADDGLGLEEAWVRETKG
jgi:hypothetical protein